MWCGYVDFASVQAQPIDCLKARIIDGEAVKIADVYCTCYSLDFGFKRPRGQQTVDRWYIPDVGKCCREIYSGEHACHTKKGGPGEALPFLLIMFAL